MQYWPVISDTIGHVTMVQFVRDTLLISLPIIDIVDVFIDFASFKSPGVGRR